MNSSFQERDQWHGSPYDVSMPQFLACPEESPTKRPSSTTSNDDLKILIEPALFARRLDPATGTVSSKLERLNVEPHLLYISTEVWNPQTKSREDRLREKRQLKLQQQLQNNNSGRAVVASGSPSVAEKADAENRPLSTPESSSVRRKRSLLTKPTQDSAKKPKISNTTSVATVSETIPASISTPTTSTTAASVKNVHLPNRPAQPALPQQPVNHETPPKPTSMPMPALPQQPVPMAPPKGETVLLRLSSGQVVLVPKELLKKISPVSAGGSTATTLTAPGSSTATALPAPRLATVQTANKFVPVGINPSIRVESVQQPMQQPVMVKQDLPATVTLNEALDILRLKCSSPADPSQLTLQKPNGILKAPAETVGSGANGKTFRYVKVQAFQGPPGTQASTQPGTVVTQPVSSLSEQLVRIQQMPVQLSQQQKQLQPQQQQQQFPRPQIIVHRTVPVPTMTRVVPQQTLQQPGIYRHFIVPSASAASSVTSLPVTQIRPASSMPRFIRPNGALQTSLSPMSTGVSPQGPMKICIIQSPRKPDGTPVSPGSATPGIVVMNPPANFRQLNMNEVLKAISAQNAATSSTVMQQNVSTATTNVVVGVGDAPRIVSSESNGLVPSQVS